MQLKSLVKSEVDYLIQECNFTPTELSYFKHKTSGESDVQISFELHISTSTVTRIGKGVKNKIHKVL